MKKSTLITSHITLGLVLYTVIACSPTKFDVKNNLCEDVTDSCVTIDSITTITQSFKVGAGKVDILFIDDNSASMSMTQNKLAAKFGGFVEALDAKEIDYNIAITTTDLLARQNDPLISFSNGNKILKKSDASRVSLFNGGIVRTETITCENFIKSSYYTYGPSFNTRPEYAAQYNQKCPSNDERGIYTAYNAISQNASGFIRPDAHLNVIAITNEDVRSSLYRDPTYASSYPLADQDKATKFTEMINSKYPGKYWEFNSIITKDQTCALQQMNSFIDSRNGQVIKDANGNYVIGANVGYEYAALSASAAKDIDGRAKPRGQNLSICGADFTSYFSNIATQITEAARMMTLKCTPTEAPVITGLNGGVLNVPYQWNGNQIIFQRGSEGIQFKVTYKCYTGVR